MLFSFHCCYFTFLRKMSNVTLKKERRKRGKHYDLYITCLSNSQNFIELYETLKLHKTNWVLWMGLKIWGRVLLNTNNQSASCRSMYKSLNFPPVLFPETDYRISIKRLSYIKNSLKSCFYAQLQEETQFKGTSQWGTWHQRDILGSASIRILFLMAKAVYSLVCDAIC